MKKIFSLLVLVLFAFNMNSCCKKCSEKCDLHDKPQAEAQDQSAAAENEIAENTQEHTAETH